MACDAVPNREALVCGDRRYTFKDLDRISRQAADKVQQGGRLAYLKENDPALPAALFGSALAGVPFVPINYRLPADQIDSLLRRIAPATLISEREMNIAEIAVVTPEDLLSGPGRDGAAPDEEDAVAIELFTSGTTGAPKSALLRHKNLLTYILGAVEFLCADESEASLICVPPYHVAGVSAVLSSTYAGRRMVQLPNFSPEAWLRVARAENVTHAFLVPTMLMRLMEHAKDDVAAFDLPCMRHIAYGGGKMPRTVIEAAMERLPNVGFTNAYGLTETSSTICLLGPDVHREAFASENPMIRRRLSSVGRPVPGVELQVRNDRGAACAPEEIGLVFVRGDQVSGEYKDDASHVDAYGWFATKDRGYVDSEGYVFLDGRADDVIVRGGENISPGEIEDLLVTHEKVKDAAAVGFPDVEWGEGVGVAIVPEDASLTQEEIVEFIRLNLRSSRTPSAIRFVKSLPYNETGKLLRRVVRGEFVENM